MSNEIIQPDGWKDALGYANGMLSAEGALFIGGQIGWNAEQVFESHDFIGQLEQTLMNIRAVLEKAGGRVEDLTRLTWYVKSKKEYLARQRDVGKAYQKVLGKHFPAMTMVVVADLIEDDALLEIEATAVIQNRS